MKEYIEEFFKWKRMRPTTLEQTRNGLSSFFEFNGDKPITASSIMGWINWKNDKRIAEGKKPLTTTSRKHFVILLSSFCKFLIVTDRMEINPCDRVRLSIGKASAEEVKPQWALNMDQIQKLLKVAVTPRDRAILYIFLKTGCRERELTNINIEDIDFEKKIIILRNRKFGKTTYNPMDNELITALMTWMKLRGKACDNSLFPTYRGKRMSPHNVYHMIKGLGEKAGIKDLHPHIFRHTFTTVLKKRKCDPDIIGELRGDKPITMSGHYTHMEFEDIQKEYESKMPVFL